MCCSLSFNGTGEVRGSKNPGRELIVREYMRFFVAAVISC